MKLLVDTGAILALAMKNDRNHLVAVEFLRSNPAGRFVMTDLILSEIATRLRARVGAPRAVAGVRSLLASQRYELIFLDRDLLTGAVGQMEKYADKELSLTDCASFEVIERLGLDGAFSFDREFRDCGFRLLPEV